ncbi:regulator of fucose operon [Streptococcus pneumoniae]|nr:regulator of fucose operon [Streptococcus pneumoniae]
MIKDERVLELIEIIKKKKRIAVKELAEITFSSTSTLRRDLIFLENQGLIKRKHGYVTLSSIPNFKLKLATQKKFTWRLVVQAFFRVVVNPIFDKSYFFRSRFLGSFR